MNGIAAEQRATEIRARRLPCLYCGALPGLPCVFVRNDPRLRNRPTAHAARVRATAADEATPLGQARAALVAILGEHAPELRTISLTVRRKPNGYEWELRGFSPAGHVEWLVKPRTETT